MLGVPLFGPSGVLVRAYDRAVYKVDFPLHIPLSVRFRLGPLEEFFPQSFLAPFVEAAVNRLPWAIAFGQVAPRRSRPQDPQDSVDNLAVILPGPSCLRFLRWQERLQLFPLLIRQLVSSSHIPIVRDETYFSNAP